MNKFKVDYVNNSVKENVVKYFKENLPQYEMIEIVDYSKNKDDSYLFMVMAKKKNNSTWTWWSCWNNQTLCLNCGHYDYDNEKSAYEDMKKMYKG